MSKKMLESYKIKNSILLSSLKAVQTAIEEKEAVGSEMIAAGKAGNEAEADRLSDIYADKVEAVTKARQSLNGGRPVGDECVYIVHPGSGQALALPAWMLAEAFNLVVKKANEEANRWHRSADDAPDNYLREDWRDEAYCAGYRADKAAAVAQWGEAISQASAQACEINCTPEVQQDDWSFCKGVERNRPLEIYEVEPYPGFVHNEVSGTSSDTYVGELGEDDRARVTTVTLTVVTHCE